MLISSGSQRIRYRCHTLSDALTREYFTVAPRNAIPSVELLFHGQANLSEPLVFQYRKGKLRGDFVGTGYGLLYLVSKRVVDVLRMNNFQGWSTYPVRVFDSGGKEVEGYSGFSVTGRSGPRFEQRDWYKAVDRGDILAEYEPVKDLFFDPDSWDRSDVFSPENSRITLVTDAVANVLMNAQLTNMRLELVAEFALSSSRSLR